MARFCGRSFLRTLENLDDGRRDLFRRHGKSKDGRFALVETIIDEAMLRLAGASIHADDSQEDC